MLKSLNFIRSCSLVLKRNAGHSKWANIRHIKGAKDAQRSLLFTRLGRMMKVAIAEGGSPDPAHNLKLEHVLDQARRVNMPVATMQSIIKSTQANKSQGKLHTLEVKGPGSCIINIEIFTENLHQTKNGITTILKKHGCRYSDGGAKHLFEEKGVIVLDRPPEMAKMSKGELEEAMTDYAIEVGAEEVLLDDAGDEITFHTSAGQIRPIAAAIEKKYPLKSASVEYFPLKYQNLDDQDLEICSSLYEKLEKLPEVVRIYDNIA